MNQINLIGRLTKKPELKETKTNKKVCDFTIAVNRNYTGEDGTREADFINCQVWNKQAENLCKYMNKGSQMAVEGSLRVDSYEDKDKTKRFKTYVFVSQIEYLEAKKGESKKAVIEENENPDQAYIDFGNEIELSDEDIAF